MAIRKAREHTRRENRVKVRRAWIFEAVSGSILRFRDPRAALVAAVLALPGVLACAAQRGTIGAVLGQRPDGHLYVREVPERLAAGKAGLAPGDEILLIDGRDVRTMDERELHRSLGGELGTKVNLTVVRGEEVFRVTLQRTPPFPHSIEKPE